MDARSPSAASHHSSRPVSPISGQARTGLPSQKMPEVKAMVATPAGMFTWERVAAYQCVRDVHYSVTLGGPEDTYFSGVCANALRSIIGDGDAGGLRVHNIQYSQLKPLAALMPDEIPTHITVFEEVGPNGKARCIAHFPDGTAFEVLKASNLCYSLHVVTTGLQVNGALAEDHEWTIGLNSTLSDIPRRQHVLQMQPGEVFGNVFVPKGSLVQIGGRSIVDQFKGHSWPKPPSAIGFRPVTPMTPVVGEEAEEDHVSREKFTFGNVANEEGQMCFSVRKRVGKELMWESLANFEMLEVTHQYEFADREMGFPSYRVLVRCEVGDGPVVRITPEHSPNASHAGVIEAEVLLSPSEMKYAGDLTRLFQKISSHLKPTMTCEHFNCWLKTQPSRPPTRCVTFFGRHDDTWVFGNCALKHGELMPLEECELSYLPSFFSGMQNILRLAVDDYPKVVIVPQPHVRWTILYQFWLKMIPMRFLNNAVPAKVVFAVGVMHLYSSRFWNAEVIQKGVYSATAISEAPNTGKSEAADCVNQLVGCGAMGMSIGSASSGPGYASTARLLPEHLLTHTHTISGTSSGSTSRPICRS